MLNWLVVGVGDITTKRVIPAIQSEARSRLAAIVTRSAVKAFPYGAPAYPDVETALATETVDVVYVATPVFRHAADTITSLRAGKHVLCEKPMAMNYGEAREMQRVAEESSRVLGVAYYRRMYPKVNRALELVQVGAIGRPVLAEFYCQYWFEVVDGFRAWLVDPGMAGGGPLYDIGSHRIDLLNYLFGQPSKATGFLSTLVHKTAVEDNATILVEYESGVRGIVDVRWHSTVSRDEFRIRGTEGEIELAPLNDPKIVYPGGEEHHPPHPNVHYPCIENFVDAVLDGKPLRASGASSLWTDWVTEQVMMAYKS